MSHALSWATEPDVDCWVDICALDELEFERGACALVHGTQVALFRTGPNAAVYALANHDPFSGANVLSRGIVGSEGDVLKVASPMYKHRFDLQTGVCLDDPTVSVASYPVRVVSGRVEITTR